MLLKGWKKRSKQKWVEKPDKVGYWLWSSVLSSKKVIKTGVVMIDENGHIIWGDHPVDNKVRGWLHLEKLP